MNDPDGNEWEVFVVLQDNLPEVESKETGNAACCVLAVAIDKAETETAANCYSPAMPIGISR